MKFGKVEINLNGNRYIDTVDQAALIRQVLHRQFSGVRFSVVSKRYAGGSSIRVAWTDGPTLRQVQAITAPFKGASFDGMIDLKHYGTSWLLPDGSARIGNWDGTGGSKGCDSGVVSPKPHPEAIEVRFGGDYVFTDRHYSAELLQSACAKGVARYGYAEYWALHSDGTWLADSWHKLPGFSRSMGELLRDILEGERDFEPIIKH